MSQIKTDEAFWAMLENSYVFSDMAECILLSRSDLADPLFERAKNLMRQSRAISFQAWDHLRILNPELSPRKDMSADWLTRTVTVKDS